ncbi:MAG TPA: cytochrome P450 [Streptosporangiaceae bacterium]|jgi:cytochrome P450
MTLVTDLDLPLLDYGADALDGDAYHERLAELRTQARDGWLARSPLSLVVVDRESAEFFLRTRSAAFPGPQIADLFGVTAGLLREQIDENILNQQGDRHRRLRSLVGPAFTARAADRQRPVMREFLSQLWAPLAGAGQCDAVTALAKPYPSLTIAAVLGAPLPDAPRLHDWSTWVQRQFDITALASQLADMESKVAEAYGYVQELLARRASEPGDDLITALLSASEGGDRLSGEECINLVLNVIAGGIDTTQAQLSHALRLFAAHPRQWELLASQPALVPAAVQEVLRHEPITPFTARICLEQIEHRGVTFPAGSIVAICAERGNREQEGGEGFDITAQRDARLLTFGAGPHFCLGANLARAELEEALLFLPPRMTGLAADGPAKLGSVEGIYGIDALPLRWLAG